MDEILNALEEIGIAFAYDHFAEGEGPDPPFICYLFPRSHNFAADQKVFQRIDVLNIELYTDEKSPATERRVEAVLDEHGFIYSKTEYYIDSEKLYEVIYEMEVLINGDN